MEVINPILDRRVSVTPTPFSNGSWSVVQCQETGFIFLANPPDYSRLESEFAWENTSVAERKRRQSAEPIFSRVSTLVKKAKRVVSPGRNKMAAITMAVTRDIDLADPLRVVDIGCGSGGYIVVIHQRFAELGRTVIPYGIEVSKALAEAANDKVAPLGGRVIQAGAIDGTAQLDPESIDIVAMTSFLEHECRPLELLRRLHPIMTPGGTIVLKVPNFDCWNRKLRRGKWCGFRYPDHVNYFTPSTLRRLAKESGFEMSHQNVLDRFPLSDNMYAVLRKLS
jgi:2-polyprenyl-3-methyl-5-hydroxy-6-metoxy-1,4-benzoquinol methylase